MFLHKDNVIELQIVIGTVSKAEFYRPETNSEFTAGTPHLPETQYPALYKKFPSRSERPSLKQIIRIGTALRTRHWLLLNRQDCRAYVTERDEAMILFALMEADKGDAYNRSWMGC